MKKNNRSISTMNSTQIRRMESFLMTLAICCIYSFLVLSLHTVFAEETTAAPEASSGYMTWLTPFEGFINSCVSFVSLAGKGMLLWAFFETATALYSHDVSQVPQSLRRIGAGCILVFAKPLLDAMAG